jgi:hypothetical protein
MLVTTPVPPRRPMRLAAFPMPEDVGPEKGSVHVTFLLNFLDYLRSQIPSNR